MPVALWHFDTVIRVNLVGSFNMLRHAAAEMAANEPVDADGGRGAIVNVASIAAFDGGGAQAAYAASKAGIVGMTLPIARDLASAGIRVNVVAPGMVDTPILGLAPDQDEVRSFLGDIVLFPKRLGSPGEIASVIVELLTNPYLNASVVRVDGGIRMQ